MILVPPHDARAEEAVIGAILNRNQIFDRVIEETAPFEFYREGYGILFDAMVKLAEAHSPIDLVLLQSVIAEPEWKRIDGDRLCTEAIASVPTPIAGPEYAREVHNRYLQRAVMDFGREINELAASARLGDGRRTGLTNSLPLNMASRRF
jgi:replicative DNA helicase